MKSFRLVLAAASVAAISSAANAAIDYSTATLSVAVTNAEITAVAGSGGYSPTGATFFSSSFIPDSTPNNILLIQDPSGGSSVGSGLIRINVATKVGAVIANDAAINVVADDTATADQDTNGLCLDPGTGTVYLSDREDDDEIISITSAGAVANVPGTTIGANAYTNGIVFSGGNLYYVNQATDDVIAYNIAGGTESVLASKAAYTAVTGGTEIGIAGGPVLYGSSILIFDETGFSGGGSSDEILAVATSNGAVSVQVPASVFGVGTEPGFSTFVVTSDGTVIAWDEFGAGAALATFLVIPQGTGTPIRFSQASTAAALGLSNPLAVDPTDENSMMVLTDTPTEVSVLIGIAGDTTADTGPVGSIAKMTFTAASSVPDWTLY